MLLALAVVTTHILMRQCAVETNCTRYAASFQMKFWHWGKDRICVPIMEHTCMAIRMHTKLDILPLPGAIAARCNSRFRAAAHAQQRGRFEARVWPAGQRGHRTRAAAQHALKQQRQRVRVRIWPAARRGRRTRAAAQHAHTRCAAQCGRQPWAGHETPGLPAVGCVGCGGTCSSSCPCCMAGGAQRLRAPLSI